jgi:cation transport ATPase
MSAAGRRIDVGTEQHRCGLTAIANRVRPQNRATLADLRCDGIQHLIRQNIILSLAIKALFVMLTFAGQASHWKAIAADMAASLLVIFNGLRQLHDALTGLIHGKRIDSPVPTK